MEVQGSKHPLAQISYLQLTQLMGELLAQDGHRGADALEDWGCKGGANSQAVDEVVQAVAQCDHPGQRADVRIGSSL